MANYKDKICKRSGIAWKQYNSLQKCQCEKCKDEIKNKPKIFIKKVFNPIPKVSKKRKVENLQYSVLRIEFLGKAENRICPVTGHPTTEVHHKMGRIGFADEWARLNAISLLLDIRFFLGVSHKGHRWIEENPVEAKKLGYSVDRL